MLLDYLKFYTKPGITQIERRILHLIKYSYNTIPFYKALLDKNGLKPSDFNNLQDFISYFPRTTSNEYRTIQQDNDPYFLINKQYELSELFLDRSSGSSGIPISIYRNKRELIHRNAKTVWHLIKGGLRPWHRILSVVPPIQMVERDSFLQSLGFFRRFTVNYLMDIDDIIKLIHNKKINAIYGQKSFMRLIAEQYEKRLIQPPKLEFLMLTAERVDSYTRNYLKRVFKPDNYGEIYGVTETSIIAVNYGKYYDVNYNSIFFCLDNPTDVGSLTQGSICLTSLSSKVQPILMLKVGDEVTVENYDNLLDLKASIISIDGRDNDYLILNDGTRISGGTFYAALEYFQYMRQFRIIQKEVGHCDILVSLLNSQDKNQNEIKNTIDKILLNKISYKIKFVDKIPIDPNGKTKILVSKIQ